MTPDAGDGDPSSGICIGSGIGGAPRPRRPRKRRGPGRLGSLEVKLLLCYLYLRKSSYGKSLTARGLHQLFDIFDVGPLRGGAGRGSARSFCYELDVFGAQLRKAYWFFLLYVLFR